MLAIITDLLQAVQELRQERDELKAKLGRARALLSAGQYVNGLSSYGKQALAALDVALQICNHVFPRGNCEVDTDAVERLVRSYGEQVREEAVRIAENHECGGEDDFVCQGQNCIAIVEAQIRKMELP